MKTKHLLTLLALLSLVPIGTSADEIPVAILKDSVLTFTYAEEATATATKGEDGTYQLNEGNNSPGWGSSKVKKVVFSSSFAKAMPTSTAYWFCGMENLVSIEGIKYLNTSSDTTMIGMFCHCSGLTSLDVSNFNTQNVTNMRKMFLGCSGLTSLDVSKFNTQKVTYMREMFHSCSSLTSLDLSSFNTQNVTNMIEMFVYCSSLKSLNVSSFNTQNVTNMTRMFADCMRLTSLDLSNFNPQNVTTMREMFDGCSSLTSLDLSNFNTQNVTDMNKMFYGCSALTSLDLSSFNTQNVTDMDEMFYRCSGLTSLDLSSFNTQNVTSMIGMFYYCSSLKSLNVSSFNTQNVTFMIHMFYGCSSLTSLDLSSFNTQNVTRMFEMFYGCGSLTSLDVSNFNTQNITTMKNMFYLCSSLTSLDLSSFNTQNITTMESMFYRCSGLTSLDLSSFNTQNVTTMKSMFGGCSNLTSLDVSNFRTGNVTDMSYMFSGCKSLKNLDVSNLNTRYVTYMNSMFYGCCSLMSLDLSNFIFKQGDKSQMLAGCSDLTSLNLGNNDLKALNASFCTNTFRNVGTDSIPCKLVVGSDFDKSVLGDLFEGTPSYYKWFGGYFTFSDVEVDTKVSQLDNAIYVENTKGRIGKSLELSVKMKNTAAIQGYQFDLYLPDGVTVAKDADGLNEASLSTARTTEKKTNYFDSEIQADSALRVLCYSSKGYTFEGNDGEVAKIVVNISSTMSEGDYPIIIKNIVLSDSANVRYKCDYVKSTLTLSAYTLGDVNGDGEIDVTDVTTASNYILGRSAEVFIKEAADVNGDGDIDVADATLISNYILGRATFEEKTKAKAMLATSGSNAIYMKSANVPLDSQKKVEVSISNVDAFASYQFDITVPAGFKVADISQNNTRTTGKGLFQWNEVSDGLYRVIYVSLSGNELTGNDGPVADVLLETNNTSSEGLAAINISNTKLSLDGNVIKVPDASCNIAIGSTTGIDGIGADATNKVDVYTISGQKVRSQAPATDSLKGLPRGIYIINGKKIIK